MLDGAEIPLYVKLKYLEATIASWLKWNTHVANGVGKANKLLGLIIRALKGLMSNTCMVAFNTIVRPTLEHASQVWSPYNAGGPETCDQIGLSSGKNGMSRTQWKNTVFSAWQKGVIIVTSSN